MFFFSRRRYKQLSKLVAAVVRERGWRAVARQGRILLRFSSCRMSPARQRQPQCPGGAGRTTAQSSWKRGHRVKICVCCFRNIPPHTFFPEYRLLHLRAKAKPGWRRGSLTGTTVVCVLSPAHPALGSLASPGISRVFLLLSICVVLLSQPRWEVGRDRSGQQPTLGPGDRSKQAE